MRRGSVELDSGNGPSRPKINHPLQQNYRAGKIRARRKISMRLFFVRCFCFVSILSLDFSFIVESIVVEMHYSIQTIDNVGNVLFIALPSINPM